MMFDFIGKEDYLSADEIHNLFAQYLSTPQKENVMTSYQAWKKEGRQEGELKGKRLVILRGRLKGATAEFLSDLSELPVLEVEKLLKGYDLVFEFWKNKKKDKKTLFKVSKLSEEEVDYLIDLFQKNQN
jgi:hypothetical protein